MVPTLGTFIIYGKGMKEPYHPGKYEKLMLGLGAGSFLGGLILTFAKKSPIPNVGFGLMAGSVFPLGVYIMTK